MLWNYFGIFPASLGKSVFFPPSPWSLLWQELRPGELAGWLETEVTNRTVARLWPPGTRGVLNEEPMGQTSIHKPTIVPRGYFKASRTCSQRNCIRLKWCASVGGTGALLVQVENFLLSEFYYPHLYTPTHTSTNTSSPLTIWCWRWVRTEKSGGTQSIGAPWVDMPGWWSLNPTF